jgi:hypothetical protein
MAQFKKTEEPFDPQQDVGHAISILKRQFLKVSKATARHLTIVVPEVALEKIRKAIDPDGSLYADWAPNFIRYNGVHVVSEESGEAGVKEAIASLEERFSRFDNAGEQ